MMHLRPVASICTPLYSPYVQQPSQAARVRGATALRRVPGLGTSGPIFLMHFIQLLSAVYPLCHGWSGRAAPSPTARDEDDCTMRVRSSRPRMQAANADIKVLLVVAVALLRRDPETQEPSVLLAQRPAGKSLAGMWEFPGGKLEPGERPEEALRRELTEELDIDVQIDALKPLTFASHT